jgi:hypothetical protein
MKGWVGWILLALSLVVAYQGFENSKANPAVESAARAVACDVDAGCVLGSERPHTIKTDVFQHRYGWGSSVGPLHVLCRRQYIFFGAWKCEPKKGRMDG